MCPLKLYTQQLISLKVESEADLHKDRYVLNSIKEQSEAKVLSNTTVVSCADNYVS